jgi:hypothetical protein
MQAATEGGEGNGDGPPHPREDRLALQYPLTDQGGEDTISDEDDEGHHHEDRAQKQHLGNRRPRAGTDELGKKSQKEYRQLGIEDVDQAAGSRDGLEAS